MDIALEQALQRDYSALYSHYRENHFWCGLYGHVHGNLQPLPGSMEVGVDVWGGKPVQMADILSAMAPFDAKSENQQRKPLRLRDWD